MFFSKESLVKQDAIFFVIWNYAHHRENKIEKRRILDQNLPKLCESIVKMIPTSSSFKESHNKLSLYLLAQLLYGTVLVHRRKLFFLEKDMEMLAEQVRRNNLVARKVKEYEKELRRAEKRSKGRRSVFQIGLGLDEDLDVVLECDDTLNAAPFDITLHEPFFIESQATWANVAYDNQESLYGPIEEAGDFIHHDKPRPLVTTFIEGFSSDDSNKQESVEKIKDVGTKHPKEVEKQKTFEEAEQPMIIEDLPPLPPPEEFQPEETNFIAPAFDFNTVFGDSTIQPIEKVSENVPDVQQDYAVTKIIEAEPEKIPEVENEAFQKIIEVAEGEPPAKKTKEIERIREKSTSRPATPMLQNVTATLIQTPVPETDDEEDEESFQIASQIKTPSVIAKPKAVRRRIPKYRAIDDEIQIADDDMREMRDDYSSLIRSTEELKVKIPNKNILTVEQLLDPSPFYQFGNKFPKQLRCLYGSTKYEAIGTTISDDEEKEEEKVEDEVEDEEFELEETIEKFGSTFLLPSPHQMTHFELEPLQLDTIQEPNLTNQYQPFDFEEIPHQMNIQPMVEEPPIQPIEELQLEDLEEPRKRTGKSSLGVISKRSQVEEELYKDFGMEEMFFSSGPLVNTRATIRNELIAYVEESAPEWASFNDFAATGSRKRAAVAFHEVLALIGEGKFNVEQKSSYSIILLQNVTADMSTLSVEQDS